MALSPRPPILFVLLALASLSTSDVCAHPVPKKAHDRTIVVRLTPKAVIVDYRLELDEWTAVNDLVAVVGKDDLAKLNTPREIYAAFAQAYGPILAGNLSATLDKQELHFTCVKHEYKVLDHLRCDFVFSAPWQLKFDQPQQLAFKEGNYELEAGRINLSLSVEVPVARLEKSQPEEGLKARAPTDLRPGDEAKLRQASATFTAGLPPLVVHGLTAGKQLWTMTRAWGEAWTYVPPEPLSPTQPRTLLGLLLHSTLGFWALLGLAAGFGAVHALTPGHGKTLVAAYLVGERGTVWHALLLGVVTTLTHTGVVLVLAAVLVLFFPDTVPDNVQIVLGFAGGLLVAGLGVWLLLRRLAGGADHIHIGGGHHHHDGHGHVHPLPAGTGPVGLWGLIVLGISGGIVPCWDAIAMLGFAIAAQRLWLGLPLLLAFSAGLAGVLVLVGVMVVYAKGFAGSHWGESRLFRLLPLISAVLITLMGFWLCYDSLHPEPISTNVSRERQHPVETSAAGS